MASPGVFLHQEALSLCKVVPGCFSVCTTPSQSLGESITCLLSATLSCNSCSTSRVERRWSVARAVWFCPRNQGHHDSRQETVMGRFDWLVTVQGPAAGDPRRPCTVLLSLMPLKKYQLVHGRPSLCCWKSQWFLTSLQCGKLSSSRGGGVRMLQSILARKGSLNPSQKSSHLAKYKLLFSREGQWGHGWEGGDSLPGLTVLRGRWVKLGWNCQALQAPAWSKVLPAVPGVLEPLSQTFLLLFGKT